MDDGGQAFPNGDAIEGMTLRDYFASQVLNGALARTTLPEYDLRAMFGPNRTGIKREEIIAADAYRIADAMLARRQSPQGSETP
jgi:hypothetical protein